METLKNIKTAVSLIRKIDGLIEDRAWLISEGLETAETIGADMENKINRLANVMQSMSAEERKAAETGMFYEADDCNYYPLEAPSEYAVRILPEMKEGFSTYSIFSVAKVN